MPGQHTREEIFKAVRHRLDQWVATVGTIGDRTTVADVEKIATLGISGLRAQLPPADSKLLSDTDMLAVQAEVRRTATDARSILASDSIAQRLFRSVGSNVGYAVETGRGVLSSMVQGAYDPAMPPLPIVASVSPALRGQR